MRYFIKHRCVLIIMLTGICFLTPLFATDMTKPMGQMKGMSAMDTTLNPEEMKGKAIQASGEIKAILTEQRQLMIHHAPINAWAMGAMQMRFRLKHAIDISGMMVGQEINFMVSYQGPGNYLITELLE